ncbi:MAG: hypothetical protein ACKOSQ_07005 [Planctomycetaceae bacterium]
MATSSVPGLDRVREFFTTAERSLLESTAGKAILATSRTQLESKLARARALRDKWRDLHAAQARTTKRSAGAAAAANARSREKSAMFTAAVERLQARLAILDRAPAAGRPKAGKTTKASRRAGHRLTRASVKEELAAKTAGINRGRVAKPAGRTPPPAAAPAVPSPPARSVAAAAKTAAAKTMARTKRRVARPAATTSTVGSGQALRFDVTQQRSAKASATAARLKLDGRLTRRGGHTVSSGKRRQAARDRRGR